MMARFAPIFTAGNLAFGAMRYDDYFPGDKDQHARVVIFVLILGDQVPAIVDTGAPWCVLSPQLVTPLIDAGQAEYLLDARYLVRGIAYDGELFRLEIRFDDELGNDFGIDATVFVPTLEPDEA